jgi:hypothetical protein
MQGAVLAEEALFCAAKCSDEGNTAPQSRTQGIAEEALFCAAKCSDEDNTVRPA